MVWHPSTGPGDTSSGIPAPSCPPLLNPAFCCFHVSLTLSSVDLFKFQIGFFLYPGHQVIARDASLIEEVMRYIRAGTKLHPETHGVCRMGSCGSLQWGTGWCSTPGLLSIRIFKVSDVQSSSVPWAVYNLQNSFLSYVRIQVTPPTFPAV